MINDLVDLETKKENVHNLQYPIYVWAFPKSVFESAAQWQKERDLKTDFESMHKKQKEIERQTGFLYNLYRFIYVAFNNK